FELGRKGRGVDDARRDQEQAGAQGNLRQQKTPCPGGGTGRFISQRSSTRTSQSQTELPKPRQRLPEPSGARAERESQGDGCHRRRLRPDERPLPAPSGARAERESLRAGGLPATEAELTFKRLHARQLLAF